MDYRTRESFNTHLVAGLPEIPLIWEKTRPMLEVEPSTGAAAAPTTTASVTCLNCGAPLSQEYCPACGQKRITGRLQLRQLAVDFIHNYFEVDRGFLFTTREMLLRPGLATNEFLAGRRKPFVKPVQFYLIMLTLYFLITELLGIDLAKLVQDFNKDVVLTDGARKASSDKLLKDFNAFFFQNIKIIFSILVFLTAWVLKIVYRRSAYTFTELVVFTLYTYGITFLLSTVLTGMFYFDLSPSFRNMLFMVLTFVYSGYYCWAIYQFFPKRGPVGVLKAIFAYSMAFVVYMLLSALAGAFLMIWITKSR